MVLTPGQGAWVHSFSLSMKACFSTTTTHTWRKQMFSGTEKGQPSHLGSTSYAFSMPTKPNLDTDEGLGRM